MNNQQSTVGYVELVRNNRNFRFLWLGQLVSLLGDWFNLIASATLIAILTESGLAVGGLFIVRMLAPFLVSPIAGVVADRFNRKNILVATDIARSVTLLCFLLIRDPGDIWLLYVLTAIQMGISGFFTPTRTAFLGDLVSKRELGAANAISASTWSVMLSVGAALGGLVSGLWGIYPAFIIDSATFLVSALFILQIRSEPSPDAVERGESALNSALSKYLKGLNYLWGNRGILFITLHKAMVAAIAGSTFEIVQVAIAKEIFSIGVGGSLGLGLMFMMTGLGSGISPILARIFTGDSNHRLSWAIAAGYATVAIGYIVVFPLANFGLTLLGIALRGFGGGMIWAFSSQLLLQQVPSHMRGRVFATEFATFMLIASIGAFLVGQALDTFSISNVIAGLATIIVLPGTLWTIWIFYQMRKAKL
ncbi:MAG: MFS transporter [Deinococcales bacterium]|nr:MFS transporter [Deinococcales bacterium]